MGLRQKIANGFENISNWSSYNTLIMRATPEKQAAPKNNHLQQDFFKQSAAEPFFSPSTIQPKLTIGQPNDKYEQEADAVAEQVVNGKTGTSSNLGSPQVQTMCAECAEEQGVQKKAAEEEPKEETPDISKMAAEGEPKEEAPAISKKEEKEEEPALQTKPLLMRKTETGASVSTSTLTTQLSNSRGSGQTLPRQTNQEMGQSFGTDFSQVRIHNDSQAEEMNQGLSARAFTHGSDIYFNRGEYNPASTEGKRLLAHELTHVVQQKNLNANRDIQCAGFSSTVSLRHNLLYSRKFEASAGTVTVTCDASWDRGFAHCPSPREYSIKLIQSGWFDSNQGSKVFPIGRSHSESWSGLENGTYYLEISVNDHNPHCILMGSINVIA